MHIYDDLQVVLPGPPDSLVEPILSTLKVGCSSSKARECPVPDWDTKCIHAEVGDASHVRFSKVRRPVLLKLLGGVRCSVVGSLVGSVTAIQEYLIHPGFEDQPTS